MNEIIKYETEIVGAMEIDTKLNQGYEIQRYDTDPDANGIRRIKFVIAKKLS